MKDDFEKQARYFQVSETFFWTSSQNAIVEGLLRRHLNHLGRDASPRILDMGCGPGNSLQRFASMGRLYGVDFSLDALRFARGRGLRRLLSADLTAVPIASESFDGVLALDVIEHAEDDVAALAEIARVLQPGGVLVLSVPAFMSLWRYHDECYGHYRRYGKVELIEKVRAAGLEVVRCHFFRCAFFLPLWVLAQLERRRRITPRDNLYALPAWVNRVMETQILWEYRSGLARRLPFGVSLLCVGRRSGAR